MMQAIKTISSFQAVDFGSGDHPQPVLRSRVSTAVLVGIGMSAVHMISLFVWLGNRASAQPHGAAGRRG